MKNRAIFLDRDGVINIDKSYVHKIEDFEFADSVFTTLKKFQGLGYLLIIVTNQSGIGRGYYTCEDFQILTTWMSETLQENGIFIKKVYFCPHHPDENCYCRKPDPGMLKDAQEEFNIDMRNSWMIGDKLSDITAAKEAGITNTILIDPKQKNTSNKDIKFIVKSIFDTIDLIKQ